MQISTEREFLSFCIKHKLKPPFYYINVAYRAANILGLRVVPDGWAGICIGYADGAIFTRWRGSGAKMPSAVFPFELNSKAPAHVAISKLLAHIKEWTHK